MITSQCTLENYNHNIINRQMKVKIEDININNDMNKLLNEFKLFYENQNHSLEFDNNIDHNTINENTIQIGLEIIDGKKTSGIFLF